MTESTQETVAHDVVVHKASITLAQGETLHSYTNALSNSARDTLKSKLKLPTVGGEAPEGEYTSTYLVEAFAKAVILNVYRSGKNIKAADRSRYYQMKYKRESNGDFTFTDMKEVVRRTTFEPAKLDVTKRREPEAGWSPVWAGLPV